MGGMLLIAALVVVVDRLTKYLAFNYMLQDQSIDVIRGIFNITLVYNTGAAFGLFRDFSSFFAIGSAAVICLIFIYARRMRDEGFMLTFALGLLLGGACGNLIDRLMYGYVIDFLDFRVWPVFNIADSAITAGSILLVIKLFFRKKCSTT